MRVARPTAIDLLFSTGNAVGTGVVHAESRLEIDLRKKERIST
jgi:hypothetical protein